ncbi:TlpA family protein disulfide reductase [Nocardioides seonyuensis]|uniref:TlpA family protein disulfide reductase n=1 Tax=Nocardioides seonyuensis TaxID=2518371 RepID=A0A4P7IDB2_9ACTN|nr:TlpA disulfide reductase family protein [Nocardioides seonyuensis]QBX55145.1 TlpA family protein disulfide reductase [Nocardioides seonyuensis]
MTRLLTALLLVLGITACSPEVTDDGVIRVNPPDVTLDSPELREAKERIGMDDCRPGTGEPVDGGLPALSLPCLGGGPEVELSSLRGPMVINLWASWCGPCRKEMPALEAFHQHHGDRVAVLGIDVNDVNPDKALELAEETGATYPSLADPGGEIFGEEAFRFSRRGLPGFVFVAEDGTLSGRALGGVDTEAEVVGLVEEHLGVDL